MYYPTTGITKSEWKNDFATITKGEIDLFLDFDYQEIEEISWDCPPADDTIYIINEVYVEFDDMEVKIPKGQWDKYLSYFGVDPDRIHASI